ncbi:hypothetical protein [Acuticoccus sediminis]|uniref:hypothetical protein n=1 Tax=Acuticoccus sediminis TaxID=2184697 RepID=UPI001CFCDC3A|nr:hypothetical protein [Acuticoccus sediminis]
MSDKDEFRRNFGVEPPARPSHAERVDPDRAGAVREPVVRDNKEVLAGSTDYHPYGYMPGGAQDCDVQGWNPLRVDMPEGVVFDYRLLLRIGYGALDLANEAMFLRLFLPECIINIEGRYLHDLKARLRRREVSFIQEFSPLVFRMPESRLPRGEPVITKIVFGHYEDRIDDKAH